MRRHALLRASTCQSAYNLPTPQPHRFHLKRSLSTSNGNIAATAALSPRWLTDVKQRLGKCITFGLSTPQKDVAARILQEIARDWRELVAGSEGFLTDEKRRGPYRYAIAWGEQDPMGHVNNIMYNRYAETGRIAWMRNYAKHIDREHADYWRDLMSPRGEGVILRRITTDFKFPMKFPDHISVYHKLSAEPDGSDAILLEAVILSELHQRPVARLYEDIALYDYQQARKMNMRPWMVNVLRETWRLQEESKQVNSDKLRKLLDEVRQLEVQSWDRLDAVEDMGGS